MAHTNSLLRNRIVWLMTGGLLGCWLMMGDPATASPTLPSLSATYGKVPLHFEANQGQTDAQVKFLARGPGYALFLTPTEAVLALGTGSCRHAGACPPAAKNGDRHHSKMEAVPSEVEPVPEGGPSPAVLRLKLLGANSSPTLTGQDALPGQAHYFIGNDPAKWRTNVSLYGKVQYKQVYPGIDLVYYGTQRQLEYDWIVAPGADPSMIRFTVEGAASVRVDESGDLVVTLPGTGSCRQAGACPPSGKNRDRHHSKMEAVPEGGPSPLLLLKKPVVYQLGADGHKQLIAGSYLLHQPETRNPFDKLRAGPKPETQHVGFQLAAYDPTLPLIIDPVLLYSTYLGGSSLDEGHSLAIDGAGHVYVTGMTLSTNFPTTPGSFDATLDGATDAFVTKLNLAPPPPP
jgi:hypothetical protein